MNRFALLVALCFLAPVSAFAEDEDDELDFLDMEEGEKNRKAREADRAPAGDVFLDEDEEEDPEWEIPAGNRDMDVEGDDPDEDMGPTTLTAPEDDEDEDMDGDPIDDLSPTDRVSIMRPLGDNFPLTLVAKAPSLVTVELPVLVAQSSEDFSGEDYWVVAVVVVNGTAISEGRHLITRHSISASGPTKVWFKLAAPVNGPEADVEVRVSQQAARSSKAQPLFSRSLSVRM